VLCQSSTNPPVEPQCGFFVAYCWVPGAYWVLLVCGCWVARLQIWLHSAEGGVAQRWLPSLCVSLVGHCYVSLQAPKRPHVRHRCDGSPGFRTIF